MPASALEQVLALAAQQDGVVSRAQWQGLGLHHNSVARLVETGLWLALAPGLHQVHPGPVQAQALGWGGFLLGGEQSVVAGLAAAHLLGMEPVMPQLVTIAVPHHLPVRVVELDGRTGHEGAGRFRDMSRDNRNTVRGRATLRYGWTDCRHHPCQTSRQVASTLVLLGWGGLANSCPRCRLRQVAA